MGKSLASNKRGGKSMVVRMSEIRGRDFICPNALNPYHDCSEICFKEVSENFQDEGKEIVQNKGMKKLQRKGVTPTSLKALKSFNSCATNFFSIQSAAYQGGRTKGRWLISDRSDVHSNCKYASNPYHRCAEDCFDNAPYGDNGFNIRGRTSLQSQCIYASIPQHECGKVCFENGQDSNGHEGENFIDISTSTDKSSPLPNHTNASTPCHQVVECFFEKIPEEKHPHKAFTKSKEENKEAVLGERGVDPKCQFASSPYGRAMKLNNQLEITEVVSNKENTNEHTNSKFPSDVQLLQLDASHLFLEWAKYCTQTPEYEIVMQAERRGFGTKNVQDDCKYCDSSILEKFNAEASLQRSLATSVLFFIGFLFALFKWTQMIRSVVMSSERKKISGSVMHKKHVESK